MEELNNLNEFNKIEKFCKELEEVKNELDLVKKKNEELITRLKSYTNRKCNKDYYERHKEIILEKKRKKYEESKLKEQIKDD